MKNLKLFAPVLIAAGLLLSAGFVFAQEKAERPDIAAKKQQLQQDLKKRAEDARANLEQVRQKAGERAKEKTDKLLNKIKEIKDQQKKTQAEKISRQFSRINQAWTDHFTNLLDKYDATLAKIEARAAKAAANGKDVAAVSAAVQTAKTAIAAARTAVENQAKKTYVAAADTISGTAAGAAGQESELVKQLRLAFKTTRDQLFKDLFDLRDGAVKDSRSAVQNALQALGKINGVDEEPKKEESTTTPGSNQQ